MMTRRQALKTALLTATATALTPSLVRGQTNVPAKPATPSPAGPYSLPPLGYAYDALEPHIDARTMEVHYSKHHQAYVNNLNKAISGYEELANKSVEELLSGLSELPEKIRAAVRNNGGGHYNHSLFWRTLRRDASPKPVDRLATLVDKSFGSFDNFKTQFTQSALQLFGSGWVWLTLEGEDLRIEPMPNQDSPLMPSSPGESARRLPLLGIDIWEHAYYLKHQNRRADYVAAFFNVVDWDAVSASAKPAV